MSLEIRQNLKSPLRTNKMPHGHADQSGTQIERKCLRCTFNQLPDYITRKPFFNKNNMKNWRNLKPFSDEHSIINQLQMTRTINAHSTVIIKIKFV